MLAICWLYVSYMLAICWLYVNYMQEIARLGYGKVESSELTMDRDIQNSEFIIQISELLIVRVNSETHLQIKFVILQPVISIQV